MILELLVCVSLNHADILLKKINVEKIPLPVAVNQMNTVKEVNCKRDHIEEFDITKIEKVRVDYFGQSLMSIYKISRNTGAPIYTAFSAKTY